MSTLYAGGLLFDGDEPPRPGLGVLVSEQLIETVAPLGDFDGFEGWWTMGGSQNVMDRDEATANAMDQLTVKRKIQEYCKGRFNLQQALPADEMEHVEKILAAEGDGSAGMASPIRSRTDPRLEQAVEVLLAANPSPLHTLSQPEPPRPSPGLTSLRW